MFKVTQLPGHQGAKCFFQMGGCLHPCSDHPASRFVYQHLFKFPASSFPPPPSLPRLLCPFPLPFSFVPLTPPFSVSVSFLQGHLLRNLGIWRSLGTTETQPSLALCPVAAAGRVGKGQRRETQQPKWNWGPALVGKETRKQGTWGQRVWVSEGQRLRRSVSQGHSRLCGQIRG